MLERIYFYFEQLGLDRYDTHWDDSTPSGIGNIVAAFWKTRMHFDGMNQFGDEPVRSISPIFYNLKFLF